MLKLVYHSLKDFPSDGKNIFTYQIEGFLTEDQKVRFQKKAIEKGFTAIITDYAASAIIELRRRF